jgi:hypothetical protein
MTSRLVNGECVVSAEIQKPITPKNRLVVNYEGSFYEIPLCDEDSLELVRLVVKDLERRMRLRSSHLRTEIPP